MSGNGAAKTLPMGVLSQLGQLEDTSRRVEDLSVRLRKVEALPDLVLRLADGIDRLARSQRENHTECMSAIGSISEHVLTLVKIQLGELPEKKPSKLRGRK